MLDKKLFEFVKTLADNDSKTLDQKVGKLFEEGGELAKKVLPYTGAAGCMHRFSSRENIIEEVADVILTALSIGDDVDMTMDELEYYLQHKANYWQKLQLSEVLKNGKPITDLPFEIHITVSPVKDIERFKKDCVSIGVKPILLNLQLKNNDTMKDLMTSSTFVGGNRAVMNELNRIKASLLDLGYNVIRSKIETVPWHPMAPIHHTQDMPKGCYYESHLGLLIDANDYDKVRHFVKHTSTNTLTKAKLSNNAFKQYEEKIVVMLTLRNYDTYFDNFTHDIELWQAYLLDSDFNVEIDKVIIEFAIYDTNIYHDAKWMEQ